MKLLSIDVGIKNLAFCLFDKSQTAQKFKIIKWDTIDISEKEDNIKCVFIEKNIITKLRDKLGTATSTKEMFNIFDNFSPLFFREKIKNAVVEY